MRAVAAALLAVTGVSAALAAEPLTATAGASTDTTTLSGEGGSFLQPVVSKLISDSSKNFGGLFGSYVTTGLDAGIADFVGTAPGQFGADFAVSERPLTTAEAAKAKADGRTYTYVPIAATPVAVATLVTTTAYTGGDTLEPSQLCPHIKMTVADVGAVFGYDAADPVANWADSRFACTTGATLNNEGLLTAANDDPTMENFALMNFMDSDPTAKGFFGAGLQIAFNAHTATTSSTTPTETWPYTGNLVTAGGDQPFIGKLLTINAKTNAPSNQAGLWALGAAFPVSSVWTGSPLGAPWNIPTAAILNAQGSYVSPSTASATAAEGHVTLAQTSDPTTDNLVTFNADSSDAAAYNSLLMEESYLIVPTSGLTAAKDAALAELIRYAVGPTGQTEVASLGAAPATAAMVTADLQVAAQLDAQAAEAPATSTTTTTAPVGTTQNPSGVGPDGGGDTATADDTSGSGSGDSGSGSALAFTGSSGLGPLVLAGGVLIAGGVVARRRLRRRVVKP